MDNGRVNDSLSNSQDEPGQSITNAKIPGGEKQILPKEPDSSEGLLININIYIHIYFLF